MTFSFNKMFGDFFNSLLIVFFLSINDVRQIAGPRTRRGDPVDQINPRRFAKLIASASIVGRGRPENESRGAVRFGEISGDQQAGSGSTDAVGKQAPHVAGAMLLRHLAVAESENAGGVTGTRGGLSVAGVVADEAWTGVYAVGVTIGARRGILAA